MTTISDLDRMHALLSDNDPWVRQVARETIVDAWPLVSAYVKALEEELDANRDFLDSWFPVSKQSSRIDRARIATDAARKALEGEKT